MCISPINPHLRLQSRLVLYLIKSTGLTNRQTPPVCDKKLETQIPPPPYEVGSVTHPKSRTPSFSEFDNLTGGSDLPSTTVLSPASQRQLSPCAESGDYVHPQLELEGDQFDNLTVHRGTKRKASTPEEPTISKRRRLNQHEDLVENALLQRAYAREKSKCE